MLTRRGTFLRREEYVQLVYSAVAAMDVEDRPSIREYASARKLSTERVAENAPQTSSAYHHRARVCAFSEPFV